MRTSLTTLAIAAAATVATTAGCGDDDSSSSTVTVTTSSLSKPEFIQKATAACERESRGLVKKANTYMEEHQADGLPQSVLEAEAVKTVLLPVVEAKIAAVQKLGAPAGDEEKIEAILTAARRSRIRKGSEEN